MPTVDTLTAALLSPAGEKTLAHLYGNRPDELAAQQSRYQHLLERFSSTFPKAKEVFLFSAPGRTEVGGNHTDHNAGRVLAAAVDLDIVAAVAPNDEGMIRMHSEGYPLDEISLSELDIVEDEKNTSRSLMRGVSARFKQLGYAIGGFDAVATSNVPKGSGLSSSAAFEVLLGAILNGLYNQGKLDAVLIAQIGKYAENNYFGKPSGLMDQCTSSVGGFVTIDFKDSAHPVVKKVDFDFGESGYSLVIVDTWGDHADLTDEYAAVAHEMRSVARALDGTVLRDISEEQVLQNIPFLKNQVTDRAILRALHFFEDDLRVVQEVAALESNDFRAFLELVNASGRSSWMLLQNCYTPRSTMQGIPVALALSASILGARGAWRVHGGGFAGTIQAFVPNDLLEEYVAKMESATGKGSCHRVIVRPVGATAVEII